MKIVITGATGFVGRNLQEYLKLSHEVQPISVRYVLGQHFEFHTDVIIHLAGNAHDLKKLSHPEAYQEANFELTKQLFDAFLKSNATTFIFMSTVKAVADEVHGVLTEETKPNPITPYGQSKLKAEEYILSKDLPDGKRIYILRPCMIHGPGNKGNLNVLYKLVSKGLPWPLGAFDNLRSFLSVENLCFVINEMLENESIPPGVYQLADDEPLSTNTLIQLLGSSLDKNSRIWNIPAPLIKKATLLGDYLNLPLNSERLQKLTESYVVSNSKILATIKKPLPISSKEGLLKTFESFKKE